MRPVYLLDTNVVSEPLKPQPNPGVIARLRETSNLCAIPSVVWHELVFGLSRLPKGRRQRRIHAYIFDVIAPAYPTVPYDGAAAAIHASIRSEAEAAGTPLSFADGAIAATARANNMLVVTRNVDDFPSISGLPVEDWFVATGKE